MSEEKVYFLGNEYSFPEEVQKYVYYCRKFQQNRDTLLQVIFNRIENQWYDYPDKEFEQLLKNVCKTAIIYLAEDDIYDVTESDLLKNSKGYSDFINITHDGFEQIKQFGLDEIREYREGYENAFTSASSQITGSGLGLISNSVIAHMTFAAMESHTISKQARKADKEFKTAMNAITNSTQSKKKQRESKFLYESLYPAYIKIVEVFISEIIDSYLLLLEKKGIFAYSKMKSFNIERSSDLLKNLSLVNDKKKVLIQAFKNCPYNEAVYLHIVNLHLMDLDTEKTLNHYGQKESLIEDIEEKISDIFSTAPIEIETAQYYAKYLIHLKKDTYENIQQRLFQDQLREIDGNIWEVNRILDNSFMQHDICIDLRDKGIDICDANVATYILPKLKEQIIIAQETVFGTAFLQDIFQKYKISEKSFEEYKKNLVSKITQKIIHESTQLDEEEKQTLKKQQQTKKRLKIAVVSGILLVIAIISAKFAYDAYSRNLLDKEATEMLEKGNYDKAIEIWQSINEIEQAAKATKQKQESQYKEASGLLKKGNYDAAIRIWKEIPEYNDSREQIKEALYQKGNELYAKGDYENAIDTWQDIDSEAGSEYKDTYSKISDAYDHIAAIKKQEKLNKISEAQQNLKNTLQINDSEMLNFISMVLPFVGESRTFMEESGLFNYQDMEYADSQSGYWVFYYAENPCYKKSGTLGGIPCIWSVDFDSSDYCKGISFLFDSADVEHSVDNVVNLASALLGKSYDEEIHSEFSYKWEYTWNITGIDECKVIQDMQNLYYIEMIFHNYY